MEKPAVTKTLPEPEEEELVSADDEIIGRAFRASGIVIVLSAGAVALALWLAGRKPPPTAPQEIASVAPQVVHATIETPEVRFTDVTSASGISFKHSNGAIGEKLLPETMGGGVAFLDYDRDGDPDLLLVNSTVWPEHAEQVSELPTQALYANDGKGSFRDVTAEVGLDASFYGMGAASGDVDCDGDLDLFFTAVGTNRFFANEDGRFVQRDVGVGGNEGTWSTCAVFFDSDGDNDLDLYVGNYVRWSREIDYAIDFRFVGVGRAYGPPMNFEGMQPYFYRNDGKGRFEDETASAGFAVVNPATGGSMGKALGVHALDIDGDRDMDLIVANDTVQKQLFRNRGDGTFEEDGVPAGIAFDRSGRATGSMGIDGAWYANDDCLGFAIGNFANEMTSFYVCPGDSKVFQDVAIPEGLGAPTRLVLTFGVLFMDCDLDGRQDLLQANGHLEQEINRVQPSQHYEQSAQLFWNAGPEAKATFIEIPAAKLGDLTHPIVGRGAACADIDADGDLDVVLTQVGGAPVLLRNDQKSGNHWLRVLVRSQGCNTDAIGAFVELQSGGVIQRRTVMPTRSYLSQVELPLTFGLGQATVVERLSVTWPDGAQREFQNLEADRLHVLERP